MRRRQHPEVLQRGEGEVCLDMRGRRYHPYRRIAQSVGNPFITLQLPMAEYYWKSTHVLNRVERIPKRVGFIMRLVLFRWRRGVAD